MRAEPLITLQWHQLLDNAMMMTRGTPSAAIALYSVSMMTQGTEGDIWSNYQERYVDDVIQERDPAGSSSGPTCGVVERPVAESSHPNRAAGTT